MTTKTKTLLTPTDYVVTAGKTLDVYESLEKASQAQEIMSYKNPGKPIYILQLVSVGLLTKNQVKEIDEIAGKNKTFRILPALTIGDVTSVNDNGN